MLRSGNGQHRRPRQAPAFVVTAGATGAGIALPLLTATGAHAASASTWDKVAQCESGGLWSANSGNGYYGGLQLDLSTWQKYGGTAYAERPDLASRQEQIAVAETVLESEGAAPWQDCAADAGLMKGGPAANVDPGNSSGNGRGKSSESNGKHSSGLSDSSEEGTTSASATGATPGAPSTLPSSSGAASGGGTSSTSGASVSPSSIPSLSSGASGGTAVVSRGRHAKPLAESVESAVPLQGEATSTGASAASDLRPSLVDSTAAGGGSYTVQPGDNLLQIATGHTASGGWGALYAANKSVIGSNPDLIRPGQHLNLG